MNISRKSILTLLKDYLIITFACFLFAFAWECFMIPRGLSAGGMMGFCTVLQYATDGLIQTQYSYFVINALLIILAVLAMGIGFGFKTIYCIVVSSLAMGILSNCSALHCVEGEFFYVRENMLIALIAGSLEAVGIGLVIRNGGSTGGTDIIALMINKYWPVSLSSAFAVLDFVVVSLLLFLPDKSFADMIYGIVEIAVFTLMIDFVVAGKKSSYQLLVFSSKYKEIADYIINEMDRGVTLLKAQGWFTQKDKDVLLILISQKQLPVLSRYIKEKDPKAFMSVCSTHSVYGEGFDEIKAGLLKKKNEITQN